MTPSFLLDTNVAGAFARRDADSSVAAWLDRRMANELWLSTITLGELRYGVDKLPPGPKRATFEAWFSALRDAFAGRILPFDEAAALEWGRLRAFLRSAGDEKPGLDLQIGAIAKARTMAVVTGNERHFRGYGVPVVNPWASRA